MTPSRLVSVLTDMVLEVDGELTPYGQDLAEQRHQRPLADDDDRVWLDPDPYPDSTLY